MRHQTDSPDVRTRSAPSADPSRNPLFGGSPTPNFPPSLTSVHTLETTDTPESILPPLETDPLAFATLPNPTSGAPWERFTAPLTEIELAHHHADWLQIRERIAHALATSGASAKSIEAFENCGNTSWVMIHKTDGQARISAQYCHHRMCAPCQRRRARTMAENLMAHLLGHRYVHICLTLEACHDSLIDQLRHLYGSFRKLRQTPLWKDAITGGAAFCEITWNDTTAQWHPHLHIVCEGRWIDQEELSQTWSAASGGSRIVWINLIHNKEAATREACKYITKSLCADLLKDPDALQELIIATRGRRMALTFGRWHGCRLSEHGDEFRRDDWQCVGSLDEIVQLALDGDTWACNVIRSLKASDPSKARPPPTEQPRLPLVWARKVA